MRDNAMFNYEYLFGDHFAKVSLKAKLLYVNMMFFANAGFVANPKQICANLGFNQSALQELIDNGEVLTKEGRAEVVLTSYFIHNQNFNPLWWTKTPYATYWKGYLWVKTNRVFTLKKPKPEQTDKPKEEETEIDPTLPNSAKPQATTLEKLDNIIKRVSTNDKGEEVVEELDLEKITKEAQKVIQKKNKGKELSLEEHHTLYLYYTYAKK